MAQHRIGRVAKSKNGAQRVEGGGELTGTDHILIL
jgi:hypothetical protein